MNKRCFLILAVIISLIFVAYQHISISDYHIRRIYSKMPTLYVNSRNDDSDDLLNIGFSAFQYEQVKLRETELEREYDLTAVLLHWKRLGGLQKTTQYLLQTGLFKEIIVWNNNPQVNLTVHHLINNNTSSHFIRIINSKENLKDEAKYLACAQAKTRACFYVDDDWSISRYLKSLIASFRSDPHLLHSVTDPYTFYTNLVWSYFDADIDLHAGFSWIGCGSIFLRQHAQRHLLFLHKFLKNNITLIQLSDVFFSIWLNDIPVQLHTNIRYQPSRVSKEFKSFSLTSNFSSLQYKSSVLAIRILERSLRFNQSDNDNITFPRQQIRRFSTYVKSPSVNDNLIFYTNVLPYKLHNVPFNITRDFQRATRRNLPRNPNSKYFLHHSTARTVDDDLSTCWHANRAVHSEDFFAIDFLRIQTNVTFTLAVAHSPILQRTLGISISFDGLEWMLYRSLEGIFFKKNRTLEQHVHTFRFDSSLFTSGFRSFRYISFTAVEHSDHRFQICEIQVILKKVSSISDAFSPIDDKQYSNHKP